MHVHQRCAPRPTAPESELPPRLAELCAPIELLVLDVDGVLTDGGIILDDRGSESKQFHVRDGAGIAYWLRLGKRVAILSGRSCAAVAHRAAELGIRSVHQNCADKGPALEELLRAEALSARQACVVGDDLADLPALDIAGLAVAVSDAVPELRAAAHYVTETPGGRGAVREVVELVLRAQGLWPGLLERLRAGAPHTQTAELSGQPAGLAVNRPSVP
jgi:3-deoxy-D-manno-octulosonate 8-phosphate phosphatase (KDO 8-P phosphatase)